MPPKLAHKVEDTIKDLDGAKKRKSSKKKSTPKTSSASLHEVQNKPKPKPKKRSPLWGILVGAGVVILALGVFAYVKLPEVNVQIRPKIIPLTLAEKITIDTSATSPDLSGKIIPAQYVEEIKTGQQVFPATGSASNDDKATGTITVFNKIDPSMPFALKTGTHFLSDSGKYFVTLGKVTVPAVKNGKPGSVAVQVQAEETGPDYNIGASKFSIPKLNGTSYYYSVYGESTAPMQGGQTGKVKKVTSDDIQTAQDTLSKSILSNAKDALKSKLGSGDVLLDGAITSSVVNANADAKPDATADTFNESVTVKVSALVFKKQDMETLITNDIASQLQNDTTTIEKSLQINYTPEPNDASSGKLTLDTSSSINTYANINTDDLINVIGMKSADQIKQTIDQMYQGKITELKVNFWPFWVSKAPSDKNRIKINLNFQ